MSYALWSMPLVQIICLGLSSKLFRKSILLFPQINTVKICLIWLISCFRKIQRIDHLLDKSWKLIWLEEKQRSLLNKMNSKGQKQLFTKKIFPFKLIQVHRICNYKINIRTKRKKKKNKIWHLHKDLNKKKNKKLLYRWRKWNKEHRTQNKIIYLQIRKNWRSFMQTLNIQIIFYKTKLKITIIKMQ